MKEVEEVEVVEEVGEVKVVTLKGQNSPCIWSRGEEGMEVSS